jgi:hypothetical protein
MAIERGAVSTSRLPEPRAVCRPPEQAADTEIELE